MARRSLVLTGVNRGASGGAGSAAGKASASPAPRPLGTRAELLGALARFNTSPDGGPPRTAGMETCYGPGFVIEYPMTQSSRDEVVQAMVTLNEDEIGWAVLQNACKECGWMLMDLETGRTMG